MTRLVRTELLKLKTIRVTYGLGIAAVAVTALFASLGATVGAGRAGVNAVYTQAGLVTVTTDTGMALVFAAVLGVLATAGEHRHTTATLTYLANPLRGRVMAAKAASTGLVGFCYGAAAGIAATVVGLGFAAGHPHHATLGAATIAGHIAGAGLGAALLGALGAAVGSLVRSQLAGVIGVFVWCLVAESILGGTLNALRPYLPYTAASTLGGAKLGGAAFGPGYTVSHQLPLPFIAAAALVAGIAAALALLAGRTTLARDVT